MEEEDGVGVGVGVGLGHPFPEGRVHGSADIAAPSTTVIIEKDNLYSHTINKLKLNSNISFRNVA